MSHSKTWPTVFLFLLVQFQGFCLSGFGLWMMPGSPHSCTGQRGTSCGTLCHLCFKYSFRACLHGGGGPQVGEVTRLAVVEKWLAFTCKLTAPGSRGDVTRRCYVVARPVKRENGGRMTHFGGQCSFPLIICSRCNISVPWLSTVTFDEFGQEKMRCVCFGALANVT